MVLVLCSRRYTCNDGMLVKSAGRSDGFIARSRKLTSYVHSGHCLQDERRVESPRPSCIGNFIIDEFEFLVKPCLIYIVVWAILVWYVSAITRLTMCMVVHCQEHAEVAIPPANCCGVVEVSRHGYSSLF